MSKKIDFGAITRALQEIFNTFEDQIDLQIERSVSEEAATWYKEQFLTHIKNQLVDQLVNELSDRLRSNDNFANYANDLITAIFMDVIKEHVDPAVERAIEHGLEDEIAAQVERQVEQLDIHEEIDEEIDRKLSKALESIDWVGECDEQILNLIREHFDLNDLEEVSEVQEQQQTALEEIENELESLKERLDCGDDEEWQEEVRSRFSDIDDIDERVDELERDNKKTAKTLDGINTCIEGMVDSQVELNGLIKDQTEKWEGFEERLAEMNGYAVDLHNEILALQEVGCQLEKQLKSVMAVNEELAAEIVRLNQRGIFRRIIGWFCGE